MSISKNSIHLGQAHLPRAREMLEKALAIDAGFAEAHPAYVHPLDMIEQGYSSDATLLYEAEVQLYQALRANANSALYIMLSPRLICARAARMCACRSR